MTSDIYTVFGGSGFLGSRIVAELAARRCHVRVAVRDPDRAMRTAIVGNTSAVSFIEADIRNPKQVVAAMTGAAAVINAVGRYIELGRESFAAIHVEGARNVASTAADMGRPYLVHISGIGVDSESPSAYVRARAAGETAVRHGYPPAVIIRPSVMFGPDDSFINTFARMASFSPVIPLFGQGRTKLHPVFVDDVAKAALAATTSDAALGQTYELGGPEILSYRELLHTVLHHFGRRRLLLPLPFPLWRAMAAVLALLPTPPLTRDQVILMMEDNIAAPDRPGFENLDIRPTPLAEVLPMYSKPGIAPRL
ncbi:MAG: complex I NDUFA9 subunit family protein [Alphaproteobacteria bacterium]|nr:complex I NDUFA9 subunit family protein [Alphaproteobacteria bacterium]